MPDVADHRDLPSGWLDSLRRSKAEIAAGQTVPLLPILDRLRASAERLEAEQADPGREIEPKIGR